MDRLKHELALLKTVQVIVFVFFFACGFSSSRPLVCQCTTRPIFLLDLPSEDYLCALPVCCCRALQPQYEHTLYLLCIADRNRHTGIPNVCGAAQDGANIC